ncbi:uncharacterized protein LOC129003217 [Macrosteles quadrilineatus]|uniref:uncharacterized protein LOC129003217 n=1 Tax=Macrosteles quadrilineatus TaxID=74068 RepID=UPI0023E12F02|nr:uncharacterized protein LOC129003217 [Macrosteles quadrilineatus]XP_054287479.1 uncharacterized protein LOC129003217 [Macrosteles quadrilineatus]
MPAREAYIMLVGILMATCREVSGVVVHATVDLGGGQTELLQMLLKKIDTMVSKEQEDTKIIATEGSELADTLLQASSSVTIKGNITDHDRRLTLTFTLQASRSDHSSATAMIDADDEDAEEDDEWRCCSSSGVLTPIVDVVEPYFLGFVELVVNGILSTVISNFLEGSNLLGDVRLV